MIGGGGKKVLSLAGREADIVSFNFNNASGVLGAEGFKSGGAAETQRKVGWVRDAAGARFDEIELEIGAYMTMVTDAGDATAEGMGKAMGFEKDEMLAHPHALDRQRRLDLRRSRASPRDVRHQLRERSRHGTRAVRTGGREARGVLIRSVRIPSPACG